MRDELDKVLQDKLRGYSASPPGDVWGRIERDLPAVAPAASSRILFRRRAIGFAAAACLLAALVITAVVVRRDMPVSVQTAAISTISDSVPGKTETAERTDGRHPASEIVPGVTESDMPLIPVIALAEPASGDRAAKHAADAGGAGGAAGQTADTAGQIADTAGQTAGAVEPVVYARDTAAPAERIEREQPQERQPESADRFRQPQYREKQYDVPGYTSDARNKNKPLRRSHKPDLSATLYVSDFGGGSGGGSNRTSDRYRVTEVMSRSYVNGEGAAQYTITPPVTDINHRIPLGFGVGITVGISPRLSLETGLTYTYLRSDWQIGGSIAVYDIRQELHYAGIPVSAIYRVADIGFGGLYIRGGGMLEKGVYGTKHVRISSGSNLEAQTLKMTGIQPSLNGAAGLDARLGRTLSMYVEPGLNYYPRQGGQPENYRTQNPVTFSLRAGLRISLR